jgi:hypothetical protein
VEIKNGHVGRDDLTGWISIRKSSGSESGNSAVRLWHRQ